MKIRTPSHECIVEDHGRELVRAYDKRSTYHAIKKLRQMIDARLEELETPKESNET